jgi:hypothetical protein
MVVWNSHKFCEGPPTAAELRDFGVRHGLWASLLKAMASASDQINI